MHTYMCYILYLHFVKAISSFFLGRGREGRKTPRETERTTLSPSPSLSHTHLFALLFRFSCHYVFILPLSLQLTLSDSVRICSNPKSITLLQWSNFYWNNVIYVCERVWIGISFSFSSNCPYLLQHWSSCDGLFVFSSFFFLFYPLQSKSWIRSIFCPIHNPPPFVLDFYFQESSIEEAWPKL